MPSGTEKYLCLKRTEFNIKTVCAAFNVHADNIDGIGICRNGHELNIVSAQVERPSSFKLKKNNKGRLGLDPVLVIRAAKKDDFTLDEMTASNTKMNVTNIEGHFEKAYRKSNLEPEDLKGNSVIALKFHESRDLGAYTDIPMVISREKPEMMLSFPHGTDNIYYEVLQQGGPV